MRTDDPQVSARAPDEATQKGAKLLERVASPPKQVSGQLSGASSSACDRRGSPWTRSDAVRRGSALDPNDQTKVLDLIVELPELTMIVSPMNGFARKSRTLVFMDRARCQDALKG